jgi:hypothetical protein
VLLPPPDADPQVIVDFEFDRGLLYVVVRNIGQLSVPTSGRSATSTSASRSTRWPKRSSPR